MKRNRAYLVSALAAFAALFSLSACDHGNAPLEATNAVSAQTSSLSIETPNPSWSLAPVSAFQVGNEIWCLYQLTAKEGMFAQVISQANAEMKFSAPELPIKNFVLGKTWSWKSDPNVIFIDSMNDLGDQFTDAKPIDIVSQ